MDVMEIDGRRGLPARALSPRFGGTSWGRCWAAATRAGVRATSTERVRVGDVARERLAECVVEAVDGLGGHAERASRPPRSPACAGRRHRASRPPRPGRSAASRSRRRRRSRRSAGCCSWAIVASSPQANRKPPSPETRYDRPLARERRAERRRERVAERPPAQRDLQPARHARRVEAGEPVAGDAHVGDDDRRRRAAAKRIASRKRSAVASSAPQAARARALAIRSCTASSPSRCGTRSARPRRSAAASPASATSTR